MSLSSRIDIGIRGDFISVFYCNCKSIYILTFQGDVSIIAALSEAKSDWFDDNTSTNTALSKLTHSQDLDQGAQYDKNLEFLDPFESQALATSSVFILLLNPDWAVATLASGSREYFTTQLDQDGRTEGRTDRDRPNVSQ